MNKEKFKKLNISAQIEHVNKLLKKGKTLTAFSEEIGLSRKTISRNFSNAGYKYSQSKKQYILDNTDVDDEKSKEYYKNNLENNIIITDEKEKNIEIVDNISTSLEIPNNQKNNLL